MKVILLQDVAKIGRRHSEVEVPDGFARNKLIPMKAAVPATPDNRKRYGAITAHAVAAKASHESALRAALETLKGTVVTVMGAANDKGHLYEAITKEAVVAALATHGVTIAATEVVFAAPVKEVGEHEVTLASGSVRGGITIAVVAK